MPLKMSISAKWLVALSAFVQFLPSVSYKVSLQMSRQAKRFSHWAHLCNFAPLWVRRCLFRLPARPKYLWHWAHLCNFAPEWDNKCLLRSLAYVNDLRHIVQVLLLAILILVKVSNLSSAVVDYYWRPFDPDRLSSSSLDMVTTFPFYKCKKLSLLLYLNIHV